MLQLYRIPHGKDKSSEAKGEPVFLMHGLLSAAENWLITDPQSSIAYLLADMGMDVWMGNARGTRHSRRHVKLDPDKDKEFWDFRLVKLQRIYLKTIYFHNPLTQFIL